jgi:hypothetical protein
VKLLEVRKEKIIITELNYRDMKLYDKKLARFLGDTIGVEETVEVKDVIGGKVKKAGLTNDSFFKESTLHD